MWLLNVTVNIFLKEVSNIILFTGTEIYYQIMTLRIFQSVFYLIFYLMGQTMSTCQDPYLNMCDYFERELNTTEVKDSVGTICDCEQVRFCFLVELLEECSSTVVKLNTKENLTSPNQLHCDITPLQSNMKIPTYEFLNQTENEIIIKILINSDFGQYKISCFDFETFDEFNVTSDNEWEVESVYPKEVTVDSEVELQLTMVNHAEMNSRLAWCFVKTPDNVIEVLPSFWTSNTQISCTGFKPVVPGVFGISLNSFTTPNVFESDISMKVVSKHPIAQHAEYSSDFETLLIYFDENIELRSTCANVFSKECQENFGKNFKCFIRGNILFVKMGSQFQLVNNISISPENKICRAGSCSSELCLSATPANLVASKLKPLGPSLSLYMKPACESPRSKKHVNIEIIPPKHSNYITQNQTVQAKISGKTQRKNLIMWRLMRKIQSKFSSPLDIPQNNASEVLPLLENLSSFDNVLDVGENNLGSASVFVFVQSSPGSVYIIAEANVTFCDESVKLYRHRWIVNGEDVFENGKLLVMEGLPPGKYIIKCFVIGYNSSEVLGQGWTTTEILPSNQKIIATPSEITTGPADNISFQAVPWPGSSAFWTCKTALGKVCTTTDQKLISEVLDLTSANISIPAETLPVGDYVWTVENTQGANRVVVFIKPGNRTSVSVDTSSRIVKPSDEVVLRGTVKRAQVGCRAWWSSVRQKGFSFLNLDNMGRKEEISIGEKFPIDEIDLVIPPPSNDWKGLEADSIYMFKLQVFCPRNSNNQNGSLDYIKVPLKVNDPPRITPLTVIPSEGVAMVTNFMVSGGKVDVSDSLLFEWSYINSCDVEIPIKRGAFPRNFTTYLPPGDVKLQLRVCRGREICSTTSTPTINVIQESEFPGENFQNARNHVQFLMTSGDTLEAFGLAITVFKSLALLPETKSREMIFSTVEEGIKAQIRDLTGRVQSDPKAAELSMEFFERALKVAKYFRKGSDILGQLMEFKDRILKIANSKKVH